MRTLNNLWSNTSFVYLNNELHKNPKIHKDTPSNFSFVINVGMDQRGNTYFATYGHPGNHWSMCHVNVSERKIIYCDSLGWPVPSDILSRLNKYIKTVNKNASVEEYTLVFAHDPKSKSPVTGAHKCNKTCAQNYRHVATYVVLLCWLSQQSHASKYSTSNHPLNYKCVRPSFLSNPLRFSKYLRLVVSCWISTNEVNTAYVVPQYWMELQESSDQTNVSSTNEKIDKPEIPASIHQQHPVQVYDQPAMHEDHQPPVHADVKSPVHVADQPPVHVNVQPPVHVDDQFPSDEAEFVPPKKDLPKQEKQFQCSTCGLSFSRKFTLKRHIKSQHPEKSSAIADPNGNCICENCGLECQNLKDLQEHLGKEHGVVFQTEMLTFIDRAGEYMASKPSNQHSNDLN